jgi:hypothetical protein
VTPKDGKKGSRRKPGPEKDKRPQVGFRVEQKVYDALASLQATTGNTPDESAKLLLHILVLDPANAAKRLEALLLPAAVESESTASPSNVHTLDASRRPAS